MDNLGYVEKKRASSCSALGICEKLETDRKGCRLGSGELSPIGHCQASMVLLLDRLIHLQASQGQHEKEGSVVTTP
jgi:hypothetical protein